MRKLLIGLLLIAASGGAVSQDDGNTLTLGDGSIGLGLLQLAQLSLPGFDRLERAKGDFTLDRLDLNQADGVHDRRHFELTGEEWVETILVP